MLPFTRKFTPIPSGATIPRIYDIVKTPQDLTYLTWDESSQPSGLSGARRKAREGTGALAVYYKLPYQGTAIDQTKESLAALMCSRLMKSLDATFTPIQLVKANVDAPERTCWVIRSKSYRTQTERAIPLERFWELRFLPGESPLDLCIRLGWEKQLANMALCDYLTATRSRDKTCFEVLCDAGGRYRLAPLMPRSLSLANAFPGDTWKIFACADVNTSNYLGATSLEQNLKLVPSDYQLPQLNASIKKSITSGLYGLGADDFIDASWSIIEKRWRHFESIRHI